MEQMLLPDPEILAGFLDEASQYIAVLNEKLLNIESGAQVDTVVDEMFRAAHSIKGAAGFLNLAKVSKITHSMETVLDRVRKGKLDFDDAINDAVFAALDVISELLDNLADGDGEKADIENALESLEDVLGEKQNTAPAQDPADELGHVPDFLKGEVSLEEVLEILIAKNAGKRAWLLRIPLSPIFSAARDPIEFYRTLDSAVEIHSTIALVEAPGDVWGELHEYDCHVAVLCTCADEVENAIRHIGLPSYDSYELCLPDGKVDKKRIENSSSIFINRRENTFVIKPEMEKYLSNWISETREELDAMDNSLMSYENDTSELSHIHELFRLMHRIKGSSASMGLVEMSRTAHNCESLLSRYRESGVYPGDMGFRVLFCVKDFLNDCLGHIVDGSGEAPDASEMDELFMYLLESPCEKETEAVSSDEWGLTGKEKQLCTEAAADGSRIWSVEIELDPQTPLADLRCGMILKSLDDMALVICSQPTFDELEHGVEPPFALRVMVAGSDEESLRYAAQLDMVVRVEIEEAVEFGRKDDAAQSVSNTDNGQIGASKSPGAIQDTIRVDVSRLDYLMNIAGELSITKARISQLSDSMASLINGVDTRSLDFLVWHARQSLAKNGKSSISSDGLRNAEKWLSEIRTVQEIATQLRDTSIVLHRHTSSIQNCVMKVRMVPIGPLFQRFHRLIRDVCKERGRKAQLVTCGESTELDKKLIDDLADPLTHLIRNAVDHGLESPENRKKAGKVEVGTVRLEAFHEGGQVCIRIRDDGRGLSLEKIKAKALENGLSTEAVVNKLSDKDIYAMIFQPGFSTADKVTSISGRGVGMDIVNSKISELKGSVDIDSKPGEGCTFTIRLPLTLAMIDALLIRVGNTKYALPLESVKEIIEVDCEEIRSVEGKGRVITIRDEVMAFIYPDQSLGLGHLSEEEEKTVRAVIVRSGQENMAFAVDRVLGKEEIVVKPLSEEFNEVRGISGATVLGDGAIALILDTSVIGECAKSAMGAQCRLLHNEEMPCLVKN